MKRKSIKDIKNFLNNNKMKAFKVFKPNLTCRGLQYKIGKTYKTRKIIELFGWGFHACEKLTDCVNCYDFHNRNRVCIVEVDGKIIKGKHELVCSKITILKELSWDTVLEIINSGCHNIGCYNSGNCNFGDYNTGYYNIGNYNSGNYNSSNHNSGNCNSGCLNSGDCNSGNKNSGDFNSGNFNSGNFNTGHYNTGYFNTGDFNTGHYNTGNFNIGDYNNGCFNTTISSEMNVFNKKCKRNIWEKAKKPKFILNFSIEEGKPYKKSWKLAYDNIPAEDLDKEIKLLKALPNFDAKVFKKITGLTIQ